MEKIKFENFRNLIHNEVEFPDRPILILYDHNGRGKTSIQEGLLWGLSGEIFRFESKSRKSEFGSVDAIFGLRAKDSSRINVILEFGGKESAKFVTRVDRPKRNKSYLTTSQKQDQSYYINDIHVDKEEFIDEIRINLGLHPFDFQTTNFLSQEIINEALVTDENIRANVFSKILSFDWMQEISDRIGEEVQTLRNDKKELLYERAKAQDKLDKTELNDIWNQIQETQRIIESQGIILNTSGKIEYSDYIERLETGLKLQKDEEALKILEQTVLKTSNGEEQIPNFKKLKKLQSNLQTNLNNDRESIGKLKTHKDAGIDKIQDLVKLIEEFKTKELSIPQLEKEAADLNKTIENGNQKTIKMQKELAKLSDKHEKIGKLVERKNDLVKKSLELEKANGSLIDLTKHQEKITNSRKEILEKLAKLKKFNSDLVPTMKELNQLSTKLQEGRDYSNKFGGLDLDKIIKEMISTFQKLDLLQQHVDEEIVNKKLLQNLTSHENEKITDLSRKKNKILIFHKEISDHLSKLQSYPLDLKEQKISNYINSMKNQELSSQNIVSIDELLNEYKIKLDQIENQLNELTNQQDGFSIMKDKIVSDRDFSKLAIIVNLILTMIFVALFISSGNIILLILGIVTLGLSTILMKPDLVIKEPQKLINAGYFIAKSTKLTALDKLSNEINDQMALTETDKHNVNIKIKELEIQSVNLQKESGGDFELSDTVLSNVEASMKAYSEIKVLIHVLKSNNDELHKSYLLEVSKSQNLEFDVQIKLKEEQILSEVGTAIEKASNQQLKFKNAEKSVAGLEKLISEIGTEVDEIKSSEKETAENISEMNTVSSKLDELKKTVKKDYNFDLDELDKKFASTKKDRDVQQENLTKLTTDHTQILANFEKKSTELKSTQLGIKPLKTGINKELTNLGINKNVIDLPIEEIPQHIQNSQAEVQNNFQDVDLRVKQVEKIDQELTTLNTFFDKLGLIQNKWISHQKLMQEAENTIFMLNSKLGNIEELENAWLKATKGIKEATVTITNDIINTVKHDVFDYFKALGGHDTLDFLDLNIKHIRGKLKVEINVGMDSKKSGAPKALFSNGEQVVLVLALFFAVTKHLLEDSKFKWIGLDEPTQYLDRERKELFTKFVTDFSHTHPDTQIFITTADSEFVDFVEETKFENLQVNQVSDLISADFTETQFPELRLQGGKKTKKKKRIRKKLDNKGWVITKVKDIELPFSAKTTGKKLPIPSIDVIMEGKENKCSVCRKTFRAIIYKNLCDDSNCISEYKKAMFNL